MIDIFYIYIPYIPISVYLSIKLRDQLGRETGKVVRGRGNGSLQQNSVLRTGACSCTYSNCGYMHTVKPASILAWMGMRGREEREVVDGLKPKLRIY